MAEKITGYTSEMCQQAMMDELEELFRDMKFTGQEGEKPLKIYKQFLPTQTDDDDDIDTNDAMYPSWFSCSWLFAAMTVGLIGRGMWKP